MDANTILYAALCDEVYHRDAQLDQALGIGEINASQLGNWSA